MNLNCISIYRSAVLALLSFVCNAASATPPLPPPAATEADLGKNIREGVLIPSEDRQLHPFLFFAGIRFNTPKPEFRISVEGQPFGNYYRVDVIALKRPLDDAVHELWTKGIRLYVDALPKLPMSHAVIDTKKCPALLANIHKYRDVLLQRARKIQTPQTPHPPTPPSDGIMYAYEASVTATGTYTYETDDTTSPVVQAALQLASTVSKCTKTPLNPIIE
ncbi:MAG TPA: hypothetical protein VJ727_07905 [Rhodanobacteraceae bacterium]|nr:hypothetical protein [Rhodanobacteraceae bacterium]